MKRVALIACVVLVVVVGVVFIFSFDGEDVEIEVFDGVYYDDMDVSLGVCKLWEDYDYGDSGPGMTYSEYYDGEVLIGKCWAYHGPGSSGGAGIGCDSDELLGDPVEGGIHDGRRWPKYSCFVD